MASHSSATVREHTPHVNRTTRTATIMNALGRRAQAVLNDKSIDAKSRAIIRYAMETHDPWLARLVKKVDAGETIIDTAGFLETSTSSDSSEEKIEALAEMICRAGGQSTTALLVLMESLENAANPEALANTAKHIAFTVLESELLSGNGVVS